MTRVSDDYLPLPVERTAEPIIGWRAWNVIDWTDEKGRKSARLAALSISTGHGWPPLAPMVASCTVAHAAPQNDHTCGIWAVRSRAAALEAVSTFKTLGTWAIGRVTLWGDVVEHDDGWRAQFAYPFELEVYTDPKRCKRGEWSDVLAFGLRNRYAVDAFGESWRKGIALDDVPVVLAFDSKAVYKLLVELARGRKDKQVGASEIAAALAGTTRDGLPRPLAHADRIKVGLALSDLHKQGKAERVPALKSGAPNLWKPAPRA
jgi:hypothetical protein